MNGLRKDILELKKVEKFLNNNKKYGNLHCIYCLPYTLLGFVYKKINFRKIDLGAQDISLKQSDFGAFTGCISSKMVKDLMVNYTIIGHSEIRSNGESNNDISVKINLASSKGLKIILCVGDSLKEYKDEQSLNIVKEQLNSVLRKNKKILKNIIIAYEPIWSIGTGIIPNYDFLNNFFFQIKKYLKINHKINVSVIYGGSVSSKNISELKKIDLCDGFLIGGASLKSNNFVDIIKNYYN